jgi:hypothetical protein
MALLEISEKLGAIRSTADSTHALLKAHIEDDKSVADRVTQIELRYAGQRGSVKMLGLVATGAGAVLGALFGPAAGEWVSHLFRR